MNQEKGILQNKTKSQNHLLDQKEYSSVGDFQILKKIGEGTFASVYKVRRLADYQIYALKKIKLDLMGKRDEENALNQVRLLASINHQNIIGFKETFYEKGCLFIVLQYADNGDLMHEILKEENKSNICHRSTFGKFFYRYNFYNQIILALHNLHSQNIIHRDIKPANIFLTKQGVAKLGDLNVSKIVNKFCQTQTGTPYYASPQIWKDQPYNKKSDIWSLGCTIYQIASLYPPFLGEDLEAIYKQITEETYPPLPIFYSHQLHKILKRMLEKEPKKRVSTDYILKNVEKIVPEIFRSLAIVQKIKNQFARSQHRHTTSATYLLKTIVFPNSKLRKNNEFQANSYLPSPSYSREPSIHQSMNIKDSNASVTVNQGSILKKAQNKLKIAQKGVSLYINSQSKENKSKILHRQESQLIKRNKSYKLPLIKKSNMKR